jgi:hypothetical protein
MPAADNIISSVADVTDIMSRYDLTKDQSKKVRNHYYVALVEVTTGYRVYKIFDKS